MDDLDLEWKYVCSRPQQYKRGPTRLRDAINKVIASRGYGQLQVSGEIRNVWRAVVPAQFALETCPGLIRRGTLEVFARTSTVVQELTFHANAIVMALRQQAPQLKVNKLRIRVGVFSIDP